MKKRFIWMAVGAAGVLAGCVNLSQPSRLAEDHPANASAQTHEHEPAVPYLMAATNLSALRLEDLPQAVDASAHEHAEHAKPAGHAAPAKETPAAGATYTCPHHPEVKQNKPGKCPKCGMKLEVKK